MGIRTFSHYMIVSKMEKKIEILMFFSCFDFTTWFGLIGIASGVLQKKISSQYLAYCKS